MRISSASLVLAAITAAFTVATDAAAVRAETQGKTVAVRQAGRMNGGMNGGKDKPQKDGPHRDQAQTASPSGAEEVFDPAAVRPPDGSVEMQIREALEAGERKKALGLAEEALKSARHPLSGRLRWQAARVCNDEKRKMAHLTELALSLHPLSRWARLLRAEILRSSDAEIAAIEANLLSGAWPGLRRARTVRALALLDLGRSDEAVALLRQLVQEAAAYSGAATAAMPLADYLAGQKDIDARKEALGLYRRVASRAPLNEVGIEAARKADNLLARFSAKTREKLREPLVEDEFFRGQALLNARRHGEAEAVFAALARRLRTDRAGLCRARLKQGRALLLQRKRQEGAKLLAACAAKCPDDENRAWARYYAGRAYLRIDEPKAGIAQFEALQKELPRHRLADDAQYKSALAEMDAGDEKAMVRRLKALLKKYPKGDMRFEARFILAQRARRQGRHSEALQHLDKLIKDGPGEHTEGMRGRAQYWRARTLVDLGRTVEAVAAFIGIVRSGPLYYYAQQALARLAELDAKQAEQLKAELRDGQPPQPLTFLWRAKMKRPGFDRAVELLRVGEIELARRELGWLGATGERADKSMLWLAAALFHHARAYSEATRLARRRLRSFMRAAPKGRAAAMWRIAFPRAYAPLIEQVASEAGIPAALVRAVAREESGFNPRAVSPAHAYGLIQLIQPTARSHARALKLPSDPASLKKPEINLRVGANFIGFLRKRYPDNPAVVPAAYNAGHGAVDRWLRAQAGMELDAWIESIPYAETRRYTRRVLQTYGIYTWLDTGRFLQLPKALPKPP